MARDPIPKPKKIDDLKGDAQVTSLPIRAGAVEASDLVRRCILSS